MAAMHFNENFNRKQAKTKDGQERIMIAFPKQKQGEFTPKPVPVPKTYCKLHYKLLKFIAVCIMLEIMLINS